MSNALEPGSGVPRETLTVSHRRRRTDGLALKPEHVAVLARVIKEGPLDDGDIANKEARDDLAAAGLLSRVIFHAHEGFNACTYAGRDAFCAHFQEATLEAALKKHLELSNN